MLGEMEKRIVKSSWGKLHHSKNSARHQDARSHCIIRELTQMSSGSGARRASQRREHGKSPMQRGTSDESPEQSKDTSGTTLPQGWEEDLRRGDEADEVS